MSGFRRRGRQSPAARSGGAAIREGAAAPPPLCRFIAQERWRALRGGFRVLRRHIGGRAKRAPRIAAT
jgi:hypothetical protein